MAKTGLNLFIVDIEIKRELVDRHLQVLRALEFGQGMGEVFNTTCPMIDEAAKRIQGE